MSRQVDIKALVSHIVRGDGSDRCRICMGDTTEGQVHLEDTVMMDGDKPVTLAELLEVITGVEVESTQPLPNKLCGRCKQDLTSILPFIKLCKESAKRWNDISDYLKDLTTSHKTKNLYIEIGNEIKTYTDTLRCPVKKITSRKEALKCFKVRLRQQMVYKNRLAEEKGERFIQGKVYNRKFTCPECRSNFRDLFYCNRHIRNLNKKMCSQCFKIIDINSFVDHYKEHNLPIYPCSICPESFEKESALSSHKLIHFKGSEECVECRQTFQNSGYLNKHTKKHTAVVCGCGRKFPNGTCFLSHKKQCNKHKNINSTYICDYCNKKYTKKNCLKMHIKLRHTVGWVFQCEKCGKRLSSRAHLIEHGTTHVKVMDRHVCHCGAKFSSRRGYERHLKMHESKKSNVVKKKKDVLSDIRNIEA